jgi:hypothetical protein
VNALQTLAQAAGVAYAAGLNLYATVGIIGLATRLGWTAPGESDSACLLVGNRYLTCADRDRVLRVADPGNRLCMGHGSLTHPPTSCGCPCGRHCLAR